MRKSTLYLSFILLSIFSLHTVALAEDTSISVQVPKSIYFTISSNPDEEVLTANVTIRNTSDKHAKISELRVSSVGDWNLEDFSVSVAGITINTNSTVTLSTPISVPANSSKVLEIKLTPITKLSPCEQELVANLFVNLERDGPKPTKIRNGRINKVFGSNGSKVKNIDFSTDFPPFDAVDISEAQDGTVWANVSGTSGHVYVLDSYLTSTDSLFYNYTNVTSIDLTNLDTSHITNMSGMFGYCSGLTSLDLSSFYTSSVIDITGLFAGCSGLTALDLSKFNTSNVTTMRNMFSGCSSLTSLNLSNFNTSNVTDMLNMFRNCTSLISLNLSGFNTVNVTNMTSMFSGCSSLVALDLSSFRTSNVTGMSGIFQDCVSLTSINLSNFTGESLYSASSMFSGCSKKPTVKMKSAFKSKLDSLGGYYPNNIQVSLV